MTAWAAIANTTPGSSNSAVPETLSISFLPSTFDESDGAGASTGTVTRTVTLNAANSQMTVSIGWTARDSADPRLLSVVSDVR